MNVRRLGSVVAFLLAVLWLCAGCLLIWSALNDRQVALSAAADRPVEIAVRPADVTHVRRTIIGCFVLAGVFGASGYVLRRRGRADA